jgi:hypothetical protein
MSAMHQEYLLEEYNFEIKIDFHYRHQNKYPLDFTGRDFRAFVADFGRYHVVSI